MSFIHPCPLLFSLLVLYKLKPVKMYSGAALREQVGVLCPFHAALHDVLLHYLDDSFAKSTFSFFCIPRLFVSFCVSAHFIPVMILTNGRDLSRR
jgi:hypothetical protein